MGVCDSNKNQFNNYSKVPRIEHFQSKGSSLNDGYKFDYGGKINNTNQKLNLKFIFCNFKIKYCVSHKPSRDSNYITEIRIGDKIFPLIINKGQAPIIPNQEDFKNGYFEEKEYTIDELENTHFLINIYEFMEDLPNTITNSVNGLPDEYKTKCAYNSFFRISLVSFLFKSIKCDFPMMGTNQLSTKTRISFYCFIEHREEVQIIAGAPYHSQISKLVFKSNNINIDTTTKEQNNSFVLKTPPITIHELLKGDLFLETQESSDYYEYINLNTLKHKIIKTISQNILNELNNINNIYLHDPRKTNIQKEYNYNNLNLNYQNKGYIDTGFSSNQNNFSQYPNQLSKNEAFLNLENLPIISQFASLNFTEYGNIYKTSILNLVNDDKELGVFRKNKQISSDDFYEKLNNYYNELSQINYDFSILDEIHTLLMRSIDNDRFMFIYPSMDSLNNMVILLLKLGLKIIEKIRMSDNEEYKVILLTKLINILMRREELDNGVIYTCIDNYRQSPNNPEGLYNQLMLELLYLYNLLISNRLSPNNDSALIELFSRLYFTKKIFRDIILTTLNGHEYNFNIRENLINNNFFLYDEINDNKLNDYLNKSTKKYFNNYMNQENYFNRVTFDNYRLFKSILSIMNDINICQYPLGFTLFNDNLNILSIMQRDINDSKYEKNEINKLTNDFYECAMLLSNCYFSISFISNTLIEATNGHNPTAVYTLFIYFKSLFDYYHSASNLKLVMDYSIFEKATFLLTENEDSISLPRLFWFYYCCGYMMPTSNLKWFIVNIINKNFNKFCFHWSFTIRQVFFKLALFIFSDRLKDEEGKLFKAQNLDYFKNQNTQNIINDPYKNEAIKDFNAINKEYKDWLESKELLNGEYPMFLLPAPISNNGLID
jgi:hypothetical protein